MGSQEEKAGAEIWDSSLQGGFGFEGWGGGSLWDSLEMRWVDSAASIPLGS